MSFVGKIYGRMSVIHMTSDVITCLCACGRERGFSAREIEGARSCGSCRVIMGLDMATRTGWAVQQSWRHRSAIKCGAFSSSENINGGDNYEWEAKYSIAANLFDRIRKEYSPDFIAMESPERGVRTYSKKDEEAAKKKAEPEFIAHFMSRLGQLANRFGLGSPQAQALLATVYDEGTINSNALQLHGIVGAIIGACYLRRIPFGLIGSRTWHSMYFGKGVKPDKGMDWKDLAIEYCRQEQIILPNRKADQRDAAEAVAVCTCWESTHVPQIDWMQKRFIALRTGEFRRSSRPSGDLFGSAA